jgi:hypothetical protein
MADHQDMSKTGTTRKRRSHAPAPKSGGGSTAPIILGGALVVLLGVGVMAILRMQQVESADDPSGEEVAVAAESSTDDDPANAVIIPTDGANAVVDVPAGNGAETTTSVQAVSHSDNNLAQNDTGAPAANFSADDATDELDTARGRRIMAGMKDVATNITGFPADSRGAIRDAVASEIVAELDRCRVPHRSGQQKPVMNVKLSLKRMGEQPILWMEAELLAETEGETVLVWKRSGKVAPLNNQALTSGLLPPNLGRDVGLFFRSLRSDFVDARREFGA